MGHIAALKNSGVSLPVRLLLVASERQMDDLVDEFVEEKGREKAEELARKFARHLLDVSLPEADDMTISLSQILAQIHDEANGAVLASTISPDEATAQKAGQYKDP